MREALTAIIDSLPHAPATAVPLAGDKVRFITDTPADYVWPDVVQDPESLTDPSPVLLLTAPGAMGKSAAAQAIASATHSPYIDLARVRVGSGSITGELTKAFGFDSAAKFVNELKAGRASLILDSVDEAQLGAGRENFQAFLADLAWLLMDAVPAHQVVVLGRRDSIESTLLGLMDESVDPPLYQVAPLTHSQANELIDLTLDRKQTESGPYTVHRTHAAPFAEFRDALFLDLATALDPRIGGASDYWEEVEAFLGYPPVVIALAERLAVDNPAAAMREFASLKSTSGQPMLRGALLRRIVEQILDRESDKVRTRLGETMGIRPETGEREILYGPDEQAARLLDYTGTVGLRLEQPAALMDAERAEYEEKIQSFLADHPFLYGRAFANVVFRDYVRAWAVSSPISALYASSRSQFLATLPEPGPFFAHFLHALSADVDGVGGIPEDLVNDAIHSYSRGVDGGHSLYVHREDRAALVLHPDPSREGGGNELNFDVGETSGVLTLTSPISRLLCVTQYAVILRGVEGHIDFGPGASVIADTVEIDAKIFSAFSDPRARSEQLNIMSAQRVEHDADLKVSSVPPEALAILWTDPWHQWKPFAIDGVATEAKLTPAVGSQVLLCLRRVLTSFRASMRDDPSVSGDKVDRLLVGTNPVFVATFAAMQELGVVSRDGALYRLHLDVLAEFEISWSTLRGDDPVKALRPVFMALAATPQLRELAEG